MEKSMEEILSRKKYIRRVMKHGIYGIIFLIISLWIWMIGYHHFGKDLNWVDSFLNASMILTWMWPINQMETDEAKIFSSLYALYSWIAFLSIFTIMLTPVLHRFLHKFHISTKD